MDKNNFYYKLSKKIYYKYHLDIKMIWLAQQLGISVNNCHIGEFDLETCKRVVKICTSAIIKSRIKEEKPAIDTQIGECSVQRSHHDHGS